MRIGFCGAACSGKTTLVNEIKNRKLFKGHNYISEVATSFTPEERKKIGTQYSIQNLLISKENEFPNFISDRTIVDNMGYFLWYYRSERHKSSLAPLWSRMVNGYNLHLAQKPYDAVFFVDEYFDMDDSDHREKDKKMQEWTYNTMKSLVYTVKEVYQIPVYYLTGTIDARISEIIKKSRKFYIQKRVTDFE